MNSEVILMTVLLVRVYYLVTGIPYHQIDYKTRCIAGICGVNVCGR